MIEQTWLGRVPYAAALKLQRDRRAAVIAGSGREAIWLLEHDSVITTGRRVVADLPDASELSGRGIDLHRSERGGLATWHGPGQLVGYLIIDLPRHDLKVRATITAIEQGLIDWLGGVGIEAGRREGYPGVWVGPDKVAALGIHVRRGVTMHGFALNLCNDLTAYELFTPCGIDDGGVTSVTELGVSGLTPWSAAFGVASHIGRALGVTLDRPARAHYPEGVVGA